MAMSQGAHAGDRAAPTDAGAGRAGSTASSSSMACIAPSCIPAAARSTKRRSNRSLRAPGLVPRLWLASFSGKRGLRRPLLRSRSATQLSGGSMSTPFKIYYFEDLSVGMRETLMKAVMDDDVIAFADLSGDRNPIHLSDHFASKTRFGERIVHGLYTASLISTVIGMYLPGPGAVYLSQT
jgi:hypothetical protein